MCLYWENMAGRCVCVFNRIVCACVCVSACVFTSPRLPTSIMPWHSGREWNSDSFTNTRSVKLPVKLSWSVAILGVDKNTALKVCTLRQKLSSKCQPPVLHSERRRGRRDREPLRKKKHIIARQNSATHTGKCRVMPQLEAYLRVISPIISTFSSNYTVYSQIFGLMVFDSMYFSVRNTFST